MPSHPAATTIALATAAPFDSLRFLLTLVSCHLPSLTAPIHITRRGVTSAVLTGDRGTDAQDQIAKLPTEIRDQLRATGKIESRLRRLEALHTHAPTTPAGDYRLAWLLELVDQDRAARREIRRLEHGTTLRDEDGIGPIAAATLVCGVGDPLRFARESKFARWCGTGAVALSSGEGNGLPVRHRLDYGGSRRINSVLYIASVTQQRDGAAAQTYIERKIGEGKTRREARRAHKRHLANRVIRRMWKDERTRRPNLATCSP